MTSKFSHLYFTPLIRSRARDRRNMRKIRDMERHAAASAAGRLVRNPHTTSNSTTAPSNLDPRTITKTKAPAKHLSKDYLKKLKADERDTRVIAQWRDTTDESKFFAACRVIASHGGKAFTLNIGNALQAKLDKEPAHAKSLMNDRIKKALRRHFPADQEPALAFILEATRDGRLHVHGVIGDAQTDPDALRKALQAAGGKWAATTGGNRFQAVVANLWDADGWHRYCTKDIAATCRQLGAKSVLSISRGLRQQAEDLWNELRARERRASSDESNTPHTTTPAKIEIAAHTWPKATRDDPDGGKVLSRPLRASYGAKRKPARIARTLEENLK